MLGLNETECMLIRCKYMSRDTWGFLCLDMFETILTHHRCRNIEVLSLCKFQQSVSPCASSISISWGIPCCWDRPLEQHTWWPSRKREIKLSVTQHWNAISHAIICDRNIDVISDNVGMATKEQNLSTGGLWVCQCCRHNLDQYQILAVSDIDTNEFAGIRGRYDQIARSPDIPQMSLPDRSIY